MLRISKLADYATRVLAVMASAPEALHNSQNLAERCELGHTTVSKVLKQLAHAHLLESVRGATGGYRLLLTPSKISVAAILSAIDGPIGLTECSVSGVCTHEQRCSTRVHWHKISRAIGDALGKLSLADMVAPNKAWLATVKVERMSEARP